MRLHAALVLTLTLTVAATAEGAPSPEPDIDDTRGAGITGGMRVAVHVYLQPHDLRDEDRQIALDVARDVFSDVADLAWTICEPKMCLTPSAEALKLRLVRSFDRDSASSSVLGEAFIESRTQTGVLATVFIDRTELLAGKVGIDYRTLLGRAIAHELGHLLLGTPAHGRGLMREVWSRDELQRTRHSDWRLDPLDASAIRNRLAQRTLARPRSAS